MIDNLVFSEYKNVIFSDFGAQKFGARIMSGAISARTKRYHYKDVTSLVAQKTRSFKAETKKSRPGKGIVPPAIPAL